MAEEPPPTLDYLPPAPRKRMSRRRRAEWIFFYAVFGGLLVAGIIGLLEMGACDPR